MTVLHVRSSSGIYGAENVLLGLLPELGRQRVATRLLCINNYLADDQPLFARARDAGLDAINLPCHARFDPATTRALADALDAALASGEPVLLHTHDYKSLFYALRARGRRRIPIVATSHGHFATSLSQRLFNALELRMMRRADAVLVVSEAMRPLLVRSGIAPQRITLLENGIDTHLHAPGVAPLSRDSFGLPPGAFVFGTAIRLVEAKNPSALLQAFAQVAARDPRAHLLVAGDGPLRAALQATIDALGIGARAQLLGARPDLPAFYAMLDGFVLPSLYEGLPLALLEAMATAVPVIASDVGHVAAVLDGLPARVIRPGDVDAIAAAMLAALAAPAVRHDALRERVVARNSVQRMAQRHAALYGTLVAQRAAVAS